MAKVLEFKKPSEDITETKVADIDFAEIIAANKAKKEKLEKERLNDNKKTLKSYRIK
jgi:hypothetical protein